MPTTLDRRYLALAEAVAVPIRILGATGRTVWVNEAWRAAVGVSESIPPEAVWTAAIHPDDLQICRRAIEDVLRRPHPVHLDYRLRWADGEYRRVAEAATPLADAAGSPVRFVGTLTGSPTDNEVEPRSRQSERDKAAFLAAVGFEFQARLAVAIDALDRVTVGGRRKRLLTAVQGQIDQAHLLAGELADTAQVAAGLPRHDRDRVPLRSVLESAVGATHLAFEALGQRVIADFPPVTLEVAADEPRLFQAFALLVRYASDWTPEGRVVTVSHVVLEDGVRVHVHDSGGPVEPERLAGLFDLFAQRREVGRGTPPQLGCTLFAARRLIELHDGTVSAVNDPAGTGLRLSVTLPRIPPREDGATLKRVPDAPVG